MKHDCSVAVSADELSFSDLAFGPRILVDEYLDSGCTLGPGGTRATKEFQ